MLARLTAVSLIPPLLLVAVAAAAPRKAYAGDTEKIIAGLAVGALVYGLMDCHEKRHHHDYSYRYRHHYDGVPEYYRPGYSRSRTYRRGYDHGFRDGYAYGYHDGRWDGERIGYHRGYKHGYRDGRVDQWVEDRSYYRPPGCDPVVVAPWPWY